MTQDQFVAAWTPHPFEPTPLDFIRDVESLIACAKAEARREALEEAESIVSAEAAEAGVDDPPHWALKAIHAIPRWDGITPFTKESK